MESFSTLQRNIREISAIEDEALKARSSAERFGDFVTQYAGTSGFVGLHLVWFAVWILLNWGIAKPFDSFPYPFLNLVVSLEAIFLALFILMSQNRASRQADRRAHLDLQINLLAEHESTKTLELLQALCAHHGLACSRDPELRELISRTKPTEIFEALKESLPSEDDDAEPSLIIP